LGNDKDNATIKMVQPKFSPGLGEIDGKMISTWNPGYILPPIPLQPPHQIRLGAAAAICQIGCLER
jgi:hypothetical protein